MTESGRTNAGAQAPEPPVCIPVAPEEPGQGRSRPLEQQQPPALNNNRTGNYFIRPGNLVIRIAISALWTFLLAILLTLQQIGFEGTWDTPCDYSLKVWSTVWLCRSLLHQLLALTISCFVVMNKYRFLTVLLEQLQTLIFFFKVGWFFYGIKPVLVDTPCDQLPWVWGKPRNKTDFAL